ncbi:MAG TPA: hypothetical protein VMM78_19275 [Thermomicrobiales bacterium]|nr:hypothetical protein [Thermomicrobiales bacterium]
MSQKTARNALGLVEEGTLVMNRLPLAIVLPLAAAIAVGIIGISFGVTFLQLDAQWGHNAPLFVATGITALIMFGAGMLHVRATKQEAALVDPGDPSDNGSEDPTLARH